MTAAEIRDAAVAQFKSTTISYPEWINRVQNGYKGKPYDPAKTGWGRGFALLAQIKETQEVSVGASPAFTEMLADIADWENASFSWQEISEDEVVIRLKRS